MVGGVGQRMLTSVSRRMAGEFFGNVDGVLTGTAAPGATASVQTAETQPGVFTAPSRAPALSSQRDLLAGIAVGAALVAFGVLIGRRR